MKDEYLGDGVYASFDGWAITLDLRAQDSTTRVVLEPDVIEHLITYAKACGTEPVKNERLWLETVQVGEELAVEGPKGIRNMGCGYSGLEQAGYVRVVKDNFGIKITRLK